MSDEALSSSNYGGKSIVVTRYANYKEDNGTLAASITTAKPGMWVKEASGSDDTNPEFELCSAGDAKKSGVLEVMPTKDPDTTFASGDQIKVVKGGAVVRTFLLENIGDVTADAKAILSGTDGFIEPNTVSNVDAQLIVGEFTVTRAKDTQYKLIVHVRLP